MAHIIAEVIIENGKLEYVDKKLPRGRIKAHIIYDINEKKQVQNVIRQESLMKHQEFTNTLMLRPSAAP